MGRRIRCNKKGSFYFITRRTIDGLTFFSADFEASVRNFMFVLTVAAAEYGVTVLAFALLGNHVHLVIYDEEGRVEDFCEYFFKFTALTTNSLLRCLGYRDGGKVWDERQPTQRELLHFDDVVDKTIYTISNPTHHGICDSGEHYPLFVTTIEAIAEKERFRTSRPRYYFSPEGKTPDRPSIVFRHPPGWSLDDWVAILNLELAAREREPEERQAGDSPGTPRGESQIANVVTTKPTPADTVPDPGNGHFGNVFARTDQLPLKPCDLQREEEAGLASLVPNGPLMIRYNEIHVCGADRPSVGGEVLQTGLPILSHPRRMWEHVPPFAGPARLREIAEERYTEFRERHSLAKEALQRGKPIAFPPGTVGIKKKLSVDVDDLTNQEVETRLEAMRQPLFPSEVRLKCGVSTAPIWTGTNSVHVQCGVHAM